MPRAWLPAAFLLASCAPLRPVTTPFPLAPPPAGPQRSTPRARFDPATMVEPRLLAGPPVEYTAQALYHRVQGTSSAVCAITTEGKVVDCRLYKVLPFLHEAILRALTARQYAPALKDGQPVEVDCLLTVEVRLH